MNKKSLLIAFLTAVLIGGLLLVAVHLDTVKASTEVTGIISSNTTWTKANSPYTLTGNILVDSGVVLIIEDGVTINFNSYYMRINGTLRVQENVTMNFTSVVGGGNIQVNGLLVAIGSSDYPIQINYVGGGYPTYAGIIGIYIAFSKSCVNWNEQTQTGCIISNAIMKNAYLTVESTAKIDHNTIVGGITASGSAIITNNNITGSIKADHDVVISNNVITGANGLFETIVISIASGSSPNDLPTVSNNVIYGGTPTYGILRDGIQCSGYTSIMGNTISGCGSGIKVMPYDSETPILNFPLIEKNIIVNNQAGINIICPSLPSASNTPLVQQNLLTGNTKGISVSLFSTASSPVKPTILDNNIYSNSYNMYLEVPYDINATNNWWGTTETSAIDNSIHDFSDDFNLGTVNFVPFLTEPNPNAPAKPVPTPTPLPTTSPSPTPSPNPTPTPSQEPQQAEHPEIIIIVAVVVAIIITSLGLLIHLIRRK